MLEPKRNFLYPLPARAPRRQAWRAARPGRRPLRSNPATVAAAAIFALIVVLSLAAPWIAPADPMAIELDIQLRPPSSAHWLGTDLFGRDVWSRLLHGGRLTLSIALLATAIATLPGVGLGLVAGFYDGWPDALISRLADVLLAIPYLLLALGIVAWLGPGPLNVAIGIGLAGIASAVRIVRAAVMGVRRQPFVLAARAAGCTNRRILTRHILPNAAAPILVVVALQAGWALLNVSALNFLGVGTPPGAPEWGAMLNEGRGFIRQAPWLAAAPGTMLTLTVLAVNLIGDGLRDATDPLLKA